MSMDPGTMQQLLMQKLQQSGPAAGSQGSGAAQGQGQISPLNAASSIAQKLILMNSLKNQQGQQQTPFLQQLYQQHQANAMAPQTNAMMSNDPTMQALQNAQLQQPIAGLNNPVDPAPDSSNWQ